MDFHNICENDFFSCQAQLQLASLAEIELSLALDKKILKYEDSGFAFKCQDSRTSPAKARVLRLAPK